MNFNTLVEQILCEMPYIEINKQIVDLEVEKYKNTPEQFVKILKNILQGNPHTDKYGNLFQLNNTKEQQEFLKKIKLNYIIRGIIPGDLIDSL